MKRMMPTTRLRFVERDVVLESNPEEGWAKITKVRILQQLWKSEHAAEDGLHDEWRDVPLEEET